MYLSKQQSTQTGCYTTAACFPFQPLEKCIMTFKDIFPGLCMTLSFNFQDFPGPKWFSRTFQVLEFSIKKSRTFQRHWNLPQNESLQISLVHHCVSGIQWWKLSELVRDAQRRAGVPASKKVHRILAYPERMLVINKDQWRMAGKWLTQENVR